MACVTADIKAELCEQIDSTKDYSLKELRKILDDIYKTKNAKPKAVKKTRVSDKSDKSDRSDRSDTESDDDKPKKRGRPAKQRLDKNGNEKQKRAPSAYNNFVKQRIEQLKSEQSETPAKELLKMAAGEWKSLDKAEQEKYKTAQEVHEE